MGGEKKQVSTVSLCIVLLQYLINRTVGLPYF